MWMCIGEYGQVYHIVLYSMDLGGCGLVWVGMDRCG